MKLVDLRQNSKAFGKVVNAFYEQLSTRQIFSFSELTKKFSFSFRLQTAVEQSSEECTRKLLHHEKLPALMICRDYACHRNPPRSCQCHIISGKMFNKSRNQSCVNFSFHLVLFSLWWRRKWREKIRSTGCHMQTWSIFLRSPFNWILISVPEKFSGIGESGLTWSFQFLKV